MFCFSFATDRTTDFVNFRHRRHRRRGGRGHCRGSGTGHKAVNRTLQVLVAQYNKERTATYLAYWNNLGTLRGMSLRLTALSRILISRQSKHCKSAFNSLTLRVMSTMNVAEWQAFRDLAGVPELKRLVSYFDKVQLRMLCVVQLPPLTGIAFTSVFLVNY